MKRRMLLLMFVVAFTAQAFELAQEDRMEIDACWRKIFGQEMHENSSQKVLLKEYRNQILAVQEEDMQHVEKLVADMCKGELWDVFVEEKSVDATIAYIKSLIRSLNEFISEDAAFTFPLRLQEVHAFVNGRACDVQEVCTRLRRVFLAFTIIVSQMNYIATY